MHVARAFSGPVQLLALSLEAAAVEDMLVVGPPEPGLPDALADVLPGGRYHYFDFAAYRADRSRHAAEALTFGAHLEPRDPAPAAAVFFPKGKERAAYVLQETARAVAPGAPVFVVGANRGGIRPGRTLVEEIVGPVEGSRAARHSVLYRTASRGTREPADHRRTCTVEAWGRTIAVVSYPGVFSHGTLDPGTRFLLDAMEPPPFQHALDWGCGSGVIGAALAKARPEAVVDLIDADALAVASARETLAANGLDPGPVGPSDGFSDVRGSYDLIVSNPPFHAGLRTELRVAERLLVDAARFLLPGGRLVFVANVHHDFRRVLGRTFEHVQVIAEDRRYRVTEAG
jgi:16S rRNA (guanine1207-N2)-methyltransferase